MVSSHQKPKIHLSSASRGSAGVCRALSSGNKRIKPKKEATGNKIGAEREDFDKAATRRLGVLPLLDSEDGPGGMTREGQLGGERRDAAPEGGRDADAGEGVRWAGEGAECRHRRWSQSLGGPCNCELSCRDHAHPGRLWADPTEHTDEVPGGDTSLRIEPGPGTLVWTAWGDRGGGAQWRPGSRVRVDKVEGKQGPAPVASTPALQITVGRGPWSPHSGHQPGGPKPLPTCPRGL